MQLRPSRRFAAAIVAAHSAAAAAAALVLPSLAGAALAIALVALGAASAWSRALLRASSSVRVVEVGGAQPLFELTNGAIVAAPIVARRYVSRHIVVLPYRAAATAGRAFGGTLLITADMLGAEEFRRLRLWTLWNRLPGVASPQLGG